MFWFKKRAEEDDSSGKSEEILPADITTEMDTAVFNSKLTSLMESLEEQGGLQGFIDALNNKHQLFAHLLSDQHLNVLSKAELEELLAVIFPAKRQLKEIIKDLDETELVAQVKELLKGDAPLTERIESFVDFIPDSGKAKHRSVSKSKRAAWDFAAELLHFYNPEVYPLMTRWVWDVNTVSGAMREFIAGGDTYRGTPFDGRPETFQGVRQWFSEQLAEQGFYRDVEFMIDLVFAWAYADYMNSMSNSMSIMKAEFGGKDDPSEPMRKLLGIDGGPKRMDTEDTLQ